MGKYHAVQHFVTRFLALVGIGSIFSAGEIWLQIDKASINWGVLQAIGCAGLMTLLVINLSTRSRLFTGLALLAIYQVLLQFFWLEKVLQSPHGGMPGSLGWAGMLILSTVCADIFHDPVRRKFFIFTCLVFIAIGLLTVLWFPISKNRVSTSYVLISTGSSGILFALFYWFKIRLPVLAAWGKNSLALYILHLLVLGLMVLPGIPDWYSTAPNWLIGLQALGILTILSLIGFWLEKNNILLGF